MLTSPWWRTCNLRDLAICLIKCMEQARLQRVFYQMIRHSTHTQGHQQSVRPPRTCMEGGSRKCVHNLQEQNRGGQANTLHDSIVSKNGGQTRSVNSLQGQTRGGQAQSLQVSIVRQPVLYTFRRTAQPEGNLCEAWDITRCGISHQEQNRGGQTHSLQVKCAPGPTKQDSCVHNLQEQNRGGQAHPLQVKCSTSLSG